MATVTIKVTTPYLGGSDLGAPSVFDMTVSGSSDATLPNGRYDAWCLNPFQDITVGVGTSATFYAGANQAGFAAVGLGAITPAQIAKLNWLVAQNFTGDPKYAGKYNFGEVQSAIWDIVGHTNYGGVQDINKFLTNNGAFTVSQADINELKALADAAYNSGQTILPYDQFFAVVIDPAGTAQPLITQLKTGKLGDYVWEDTDNDGIQDANESGVNGVVVQLLDGNGNLLSTTQTGDDLSTVAVEQGFYEFTGLAGGNYQVRFFKPEEFAAFTQANANGNAQDAADSDAVNGLSHLITLANGGIDRTIDAGLIKPNASLGDYVWEDKNYDGQQNDGALTGINGVTVKLYTGAGVFVKETTTATDVNGNAGYYLFKDLIPGDYKVEFVKPTGYAFTKQDIGADGSDSDADTATGQTIATTLVSGENDLTWDAGLVKLASIGDRVWNDTDADGIQDDGETGRQGVRVELYTCVDDQQGAFVDFRLTDANGNYTFDGLLPGEYMVKFIAPNGTVLSTANVGVDDAKDSDANTTTGLTGCYELEAGENDTTVDAGLYETACLGDYVWEDKNYDGQQNDGALTGINGVTVKLYTGAGVFVKETTTATDVNGNAGYYLFKDLIPGDYKVEFVKPTGYAFTKQDIGADGSDSDADTATGQTIATTLVSGENDLTWDAGLVKLASIGDKVWLDCDMDGIQDAGEPGVADVTVQLKDGTGAVVGTTKTDLNGNYLFKDLTPGDYSVTFVKPANYSFTTKDAGADDGKDSDADQTTGSTITTFLSSGESDLTWDAGLTAAKQCLTFDFSGSSSVYGDYGNIRSYTSNGVAVNVSAYSRDRTTGAFDTAYLGAYGGGLGVTDKSESGSGNTHTVDNLGGRDNYVMFEFNQTVVLDAAYLGYVVNDSDLQVWIGNFSTPFTNHLTLSSSVLSSMGFTEVNTTTLTGARLADLNAGQYAGNVIVIAADTTDTSPEDNFKIDQLKVCTMPCVCPPVGKASIGDFVWHDKNANGIQDAGESGIGNVKVNLLNAGGTVLATTYTDVNGKYLFSNLTPGDYKVQVVKPSGYVISARDQGANNAVDSDIDSTGTTVLTTLVAGENDLSWDAGLYKKACIGDKVWEDSNHNWLQDSWESGIGNVKVTLQKLVNGVAQNVATKYTNSYGNYSFDNLDPGNYRLVFDKSGTYYKGIWMGNWYWGRKDVGTNDAIDGDAYSTTNSATTAWTYLESGENDKTWDAAITPLVIDLNGDGVRTVARADSGGKFDLFGNGNAIHSGWVSAEDGLLAVDKNGNGIIDSINELFGGLAKGAGFAQLGQYDSNGDGQVNDADAEFAALRVWRDDNGNHATDAGELMTLSQAGVASLKVGYVEMPMVDAQGNLHLERSSATLSDGTTVDMTDVYFNVSATDAEAAGVQTMSLAHFVNDDTTLDGLLAGLGENAAAQASAPATSDAALVADYEAARSILSQLDMHEQLIAA